MPEKLTLYVEDDSHKSKRVLDFFLSCMGIYDVPDIKIKKGNKKYSYYVDEKGNIYKGFSEIKTRIELYFKK